MALHLSTTIATATRKESSQSFSPDSQSGKACVRGEPRVQEKLRKQTSGTLSLKRRKETLLLPKIPNLRNSSNRKEGQMQNKLK